MYVGLMIHNHIALSLVGCTLSDKIKIILVAILGGKYLGMLIVPLNSSFSTTGEVD